MGLGDQSKEDIWPKTYPTDGKALEWFKYNRQEDNNKYGGNIEPSYSMSGKFGEYYQTEGHFLCFNPYEFKDPEALKDYIEE